jgi:hypothetical protein
MSQGRPVPAFRKGSYRLGLFVFATFVLSLPASGQNVSLPQGQEQQAPRSESMDDVLVLPVQTISASPPAVAPPQPLASSAPGSYILSLFDQGPQLNGPCLPPDGIPNPSDLVFRFGWWGLWRSGNPWVIGQWQSTDPSPFWDVDGLYTNGTRTFNYWATGTDNESTKAGVQYFGPNSQGGFFFNRFPHAEEHQNFNNMAASALVPGKGPGSGQPIISQDLNLGEDYVIRVDQYEAKYKYNVFGQPNKDNVWISAGINIWDQQEMGSRQANDTVHCFMAKTGSGQQNSCHVLSQAQAINWNTFEVTPILEGRFGNVTLRYAHILRVFSTNDQTVIGQYTDGGANILNGQFPYAVVPQSLFNMDKIQMGIDINDCNHIYAYGYFSEIENSEAGVSREQGGVDLRWTNTAIKGLNLTTYFKNDNQSGNRPTSLTTPDQKQGLTLAQQQAELFQIPNQIGFTRYTAGEKFSWRPWTENCDSLPGRIVITGGYEFDDLIRANENWYFPSLSATPPFHISPTTPVFYQPNTTSNTFNIGVQTPWADSLHTYLRYKLRFIHDDLLGYTPLNYGVNSSLPDTENIIEFGGEWFPSDRFGAAFNQTFDLSSRSGAPLPVAGNPVLIGTSPGDVLNFGEQSYLTAFTCWFRPTDKLTVSANSDYFSNQIRQNITIGDDSSTTFSGSGANFVSFAPYTSPWVYGGTAVEFGGSICYQFNCRLRLIADYEVTFGKDLITSGGVVVGQGTPVVNTFIPLGSYSAVRNVMQQARVGLDWKARERLAMYLTYQYVSFEDRADSSNTGSMNMVLGGMSYRW